MKRLSTVIVAIAVVFVTVFALRVSVQGSVIQTSEITITGTAQAADVITLMLYVPPAFPCDEFVDCLNPPTNENNCSAQSTCAFLDDAEIVAQKIAATVNGSCGVKGYSASATGNVVTITALFDFACCLSFLTDQADPCFGEGVSLEDDLGNPCAVNNACNGVRCDELDPHVSGLQFRKTTTSPIPVEDSTWGFIKSLFR